MEEIFKNAKFGDKFRTRDGRMVIFHCKDRLYSDSYSFFNEDDIFSYSIKGNGRYLGLDKEHKLDIISRWEDEFVDITTKILRESGFEVYDLNPTYNTFWRQKDDKDGQEVYNIEIDKYFGDDYYSIDIRHIGHGSIKKRIRYVHELQQCLRIVDLDEIANCIKV